MEDIKPSCTNQRDKGNLVLALSDVGEALRKYHLIGTLGWQDVATRYRRSRIGPFWLSINLAVMITALGFVFGALLDQPLQEFLPYLATGMVIWGFIASNINEGCTAFSDASGAILQVKMPLWVQIARVMWKNIIILAHNAIIIPIVFLVFWRPFSPEALFLIPGLMLLVANLLWMMMIVAIVCARFRDVTQIVSNAVQVLFYVTPVMWQADDITPRIGTAVLHLNPFNVLLSLVRSPLLGEALSVYTWSTAGVMAAVGWIAALGLYGSRVKRVPYWL